MMQPYSEYKNTFFSGLRIFNGEFSSGGIC